MNNLNRLSPKEPVIRSYVGGHDIVVYSGAQYNAATRRYYGGTPVAVIPYSGRMLSAYPAPQQELPPLEWQGAKLPLHAEAGWERVDPIPPVSECDFALVSAMYVTACRSLGLDTSRLLTVGGTVVDASGRVLGTAWLNRN